VHYISAGGADTGDVLPAKVTKLDSAACATGSLSHEERSVLTGIVADNSIS